MVAGEDDSAQGDSEATDSDDESELSEEDLQGLTIAEKEERLSWEEATVKSLRNEARAHSKEVQRQDSKLSRKATLSLISLYPGPKPPSLMLSSMSLVSVKRGCVVALWHVMARNARSMGASRN